MARFYTGIISRDPSQVERLFGAAPAPSVVRTRLVLGEWHVAIDAAAAADDVAHDAARLLLLDRPATGGSSGPVDRRVRHPAATLLQSTAPTLVAELHDPIAFVRFERSGSLVLFRGIYSGRSIFYALIDGAVVFGSELGLVQERVQLPHIDAEGLAEILRMRWSAGRRSLVDGIHQVLPGELVTIDPSLGVQGDFATRPRFAARPAEWSLADAVAATEVALRAEMRVIAAQVPKAVVPLSAGVDSSLILGLAREEFAEVVAITGDWEGAGNPELETARQTAAALGVPHYGAVMSDADIPELWRTVAARLAPVPRRLSALPLLACFRHPAARGGVVLYGEAADTLFGSRQVGWLAQAARRRARLLALPAWQRRILRSVAALIGRAPGRLVPRLLDHDESQLFVLDSSVEYRLSPGLHFPGYPERPELPEGFEALEQEHLDLTPEQRYQDYLLRVDIPDHLIMVARLADAAGVEAVNLFTTPSVQDVAASLDRDLMVRDGMSKPVLRELAGRYVARTVIEAPKLGFPTPNLRWLRQPLAAEVAAVRDLAAGGSDGWWITPAMAALPVEADADAWWMTLGLSATLRSLNVGPPEVLSRVEAVDWSSRSARVVK